MYNEFERVVLTEDLPELGLVGGDVGVVVMIHQEGKAYESDRRSGRVSDAGG